MPNTGDRGTARPFPDRRPEGAGIALWDRLVVPYYRLGLVSSGHDEELLRRQMVRLAEFASAVAAAEAASVLDRHERSARSARLGAVGLEYRARLQDWTDWNARLLKDDDLARWLANLTHMGGTVSGILIVLLPLYVIAAVVRRACGMGRMDRLRRALERQQCPDCRFDLSRTSPPISEKEAGCWIGPERCPECGGRWPMVPPRVASAQR